jgi:hypothetical protein
VASTCHDSRTSRSLSCTDLAVCDLDRPQLWRSRGLRGNPPPQDLVRRRSKPSCDPKVVGILPAETTLNARQFSSEICEFSVHDNRGEQTRLSPCPDRLRRKLTLTAPRGRPSHCRRQYHRLAAARSRADHLPRLGRGRAACFPSTTQKRSPPACGDRKAGVFLRGDDVPRRQRIGRAAADADDQPIAAREPWQLGGTERRARREHELAVMAGSPVRISCARTFGL